MGFLAHSELRHRFQVSTCTMGARLCDGVQGFLAHESCWGYVLEYPGL